MARAGNLGAGLPNLHVIQVEKRQDLETAGFGLKIDEAEAHHGRSVTEVFGRHGVTVSRGTLTLHLTRVERRNPLASTFLTGP